MSKKVKRFDACLLRITSGECIVAEWHQLVTTIDKAKLKVGSHVGYKLSSKTREKILRGTILVIGSVQLCEQQMKLFNKKQTKKVEEAESDDDDDDEESSESDDDRLQIVEEEENDVHESESTSSQQIRIRQEKNKNQVKKSKETPSNDNDENEDDAHELESTSSQKMKIRNEKNKNQVKKSKEISSNNDDDDDEEQTSIRLSRKRALSDDETDPLPPPSKRSIISLARLQELEAEIIRLKRQIEKFRTEWMPRPTDPAIIRFFIRMGELFSSGGEAAEGRGDKLAHACSILNVDEESLKKWQKPNGTKTARSIVRAFYPPNTRADVTSDDIEANFRQAIHDIIDIYHGMEGLTGGQINESINNVFRSAKSQQKEKPEKKSSTQSTTDVLKPMTNRKKTNTSDKENICLNNQ